MSAYRWEPGSPSPGGAPRDDGRARRGAPRPHARPSSSGRPTSSRSGGSGRSPSGDPEPASNGHGGRADDEYELDSLPAHPLAPSDPDDRPRVDNPNAMAAGLAMLRGGSDAPSPAPPRPSAPPSGGERPPPSPGVSIFGRSVNEAPPPSNRARPQPEPPGPEPAARFARPSRSAGFPEQPPAPPPAARAPEPPRSLFGRSPDAPTASRSAAPAPSAPARPDPTPPPARARVEPGTPTVRRAEPPRSAPVGPADVPDGPAFRSPAPPRPTPPGSRGPGARSAFAAGMGAVAGAPPAPAPPSNRWAGDPRTGAPGGADPRRTGQPVGDPGTIDLRTGAPRPGDPRRVPPPVGDPGPIDLRTGAPRPGDPAVVRPDLPPPPHAAVAPPVAPPAARVRPEPRLVPPESGANRLFAVPDTNGPRVLLGIAWVVVLVPAVFLGVPAMALLFGSVAGCAAWGTARAWQRRGYEPDHRIAAGAAVAVSAVAAVHVSLAGALLMTLPVVAILAAAAAPSNHVRRAPIMGTAGATLRAVVPPCIAVVGVMLVAQSGVWILLVFVGLVSAYDAGSFLIGAEARTPVPGIIGGVLCTVVAGVPLMVSQLPPFDGRPVGLVFAALIGVVAPLGQMVASLSLPAAAEWVGPLRRLDAYIVTGPLFAWVVAQFLAVG